MRIMERSLRISWVQADGGIGTEHLLVALLEQEDETVEAVLAAAGHHPRGGGAAGRRFVGRTHRVGEPGP